MWLAIHHGVQNEFYTEVSSTQWSRRLETGLTRFSGSTLTSRGSATVVRRPLNELHVSTARAAYAASDARPVKLRPPPLSHAQAVGTYTSNAGLISAERHGDIDVYA
jgi:hypothetical protein